MTITKEQALYGILYGGRSYIREIALCWVWGIIEKKKIIRDMGYQLSFFQEDRVGESM